MKPLDTLTVNDLISILIRFLGPEITLLLLLAGLAALAQAAVRWLW